jgi:hypothetical protein
MQVFLRLIELKPGSSKQVGDWSTYMAEHRERALQSIQDEGVSVESWFSLALDGKEYLACYMRANSIKASQEVAAKSANPVDEYHHQFKVDTWARGAGAVGSLLLDLAADPDTGAA